MIKDDIIKNVNSWKDVEKSLSTAKNQTDRFALFLGYFGEEYFTRTGRFPILVGGGAVEIITQGGYSTGDLDLLCNLTVSGDILKQWSFKSRGNFRGFIHPSEDLYVEILGGQEVNDDPDATTRAEALVLGDNRRFHIISLEDLIIDRLRACVYWKHGESGVWAKVMIKIGLETRESLDSAYIRKKLSGSGEKEILEAFEEHLKALRQPEGRDDGAPAPTEEGTP